MAQLDYRSGANQFHCEEITHEGVVVSGLEKGDSKEVV